MISTTRSLAGGDGQLWRAAGWILPLVLAIGASSCDAPTVPEVAVAYPPGVNSLTVDADWMDEDGVFHVRAGFIDPHSGWTDGEYLTVTVHSTAGEAEEIRLRGAICSDERPAYLCRTFFVWLRPGYSRERFEFEMRKFDVRMFTVYDGRTWDFMSGYAFGDWDTTIGIILARPDVERVEPNRWVPDDLMYCCRANPDRVAGALPFRTGGPTPNDGVVSARVGDTLIVSYVQPSGEISTTRVVR